MAGCPPRPSPWSRCRFPGRPRTPNRSPCPSSTPCSTATPTSPTWASTTVRPSVPSRPPGVGATRCSSSWRCPRRPARPTGSPSTRRCSTPRCTAGSACSTWGRTTRADCRSRGPVSSWGASASRGSACGSRCRTRCPCGSTSRVRTDCRWPACGGSTCARWSRPTSKRRGATASATSTSWAGFPLRPGRPRTHRPPVSPRWAGSPGPRTGSPI